MYLCVCVCFSVYFIVCACVQVFHGVHVELKGQLPGASSLLPPCDWLLKIKLRSGRQAL